MHPSVQHRPGTRLHSLLAGLVLAQACALPAHAASITVTSTADTIALDGLVTLREALTAAVTNTKIADAGPGSVGVDVINFNIAGLPGTVHTIKPQSALPTITETVVINGYSQLGSSQNSLATGTNAFLTIELDGTNAGFAAGLTLSAPSSTIQGLVINNFLDEGILVIGTGNNLIRGNFIGTDATGSLERGNGVAGISLSSPTNRVGGPAPGDRNLISGNAYAGVNVSTANATLNRIEGNLIGTRKNGVDALPNNGNGVRLSAGSGNSVGGVAAGTGNLIAYNTGNGVAVVSGATGNLILANAVTANAGIGIDLGADGVTLNDIDDLDDGGNGAQNNPVLTSVYAVGTTKVGLVLDTPLAAAGQTYTFAFYSSLNCDTSGFGEGERFLGIKAAVIDLSESYSIDLPSLPPANHRYLTVTATDPSNNTSEFSGCAQIEPLYANSYE